MAQHFWTKQGDKVTIIVLYEVEIKSYIQTKVSISVLQKEPVLIAIVKVIHPTNEH